MISGWINLYKTPGMTSTHALNQLKRLLGKVKIGHAGTLDPLAFGVLPVALGEATKTIPYMVDRTKTYRFYAVWGSERDTDDSSGSITHESDGRPSITEIQSILGQFLGDYEQQPPVYSAKKVEGVRSCDRTRMGETVILMPNTVHIQSLTIINDHIGQSTHFELVCSKGTYVRAIVRAMGRMLGCYAYAEAIERTCVGLFKISDAITIEKLAVMEKISIVGKIIMPLEIGLDDIPAILMTWEQVKSLRLGQGVAYNKDDVVISGTQPQPYVCVDPDQKAVAMAFLNDHVLHPYRVFNS